MKQEKKKKILELIKSKAFCNSFLILCSLLGAMISISNMAEGLNIINVLGFPIAFTIGINGVVFIPMICDKKLVEIEKSEIVEINKLEVKEIKEPNLIIKQSKCSEEVTNIINNILSANSNIGIKKELLSEWEEYLENTLLDPNGIKLIQELIYYLLLLNSMAIEQFILLVESKEDILDLLIHFSDNGEILAQKLNRIDKELTKERI